MSPSSEQRQFVSANVKYFAPGGACLVKRGHTSHLDCGCRIKDMTAAQDAWRLRRSHISGTYTRAHTTWTFEACFRETSLGTLATMAAIGSTLGSISAGDPHCCCSRSCFIAQDNNHVVVFKYEARAKAHAQERPNATQEGFTASHQSCEPDLYIHMALHQRPRDRNPF